MKKVMITTFLILINLTLTAPTTSYCYIERGNPVYIFNASDPFLRAVMRYESNFNASAVNPISGARGVLQILPVMIREVNKYSKVKYTWNDAFDPVKSIEIWYTVQGAKNPGYYPDRAIRIWFGIGRQYDGKTWCGYYNEVMGI
jgi:hypothetical protein